MLAISVVAGAGVGGQATLWAAAASNNFNYKLSPKLNLSNNWIAIQPQHRRPGQASLRVEI